jgi:hypothetical protein
MANTVVMEIHQQRLDSSYVTHCLDLSDVDERINAFAAFVQSNSTTIFTCLHLDNILMIIRAGLASASSASLHGSIEEQGDPRET